ncbi:H-NS histone family protein [Jannaschia sp. W003]|uniref:H-NS histone family protein n=1 Tax=Jannaschia sp. W003 TaxID=2867012 RepID=UPI0021A55244|nr:H-NS histone family protein [Jannaschia sp. W003]UWQ21669.1 H-NS histone family protein [Jannaschia sp. W003]
MTREDLEKAKADAEANLKAIAKAQAEYDGRRLKELRAEIDAMLAKEGYSLDDLTGGNGGQAQRKAGGGRAKSPAKYRHPENPSITWSGRGRQPAWYKSHLEDGGKPEDLAI